MAWWRRSRRVVPNTGWGRRGLVLPARGTRRIFPTGRRSGIASGWGTAGLQVVLLLNPDIPIDPQLSSLDRVSVVLERGILSIQSLLKRHKRKPSEVLTSDTAQIMVPFVATGEAVKGDVDLTEATEALKETSDVTFLESIRDVSNEEGSAASTLLFSSTIHWSRSTTLLFKLATRRRTGTVARGRP